MKKIAILGAGNMGSAIAASVAGEGYELACTAQSQATLERVSNLIPEATVTTDNKGAAENADIVILAVKPYMAVSVTDEIRNTLRQGATVISVVASLSVGELEEMLDARQKSLAVFKVIPNTAIRYGESATFISHSAGAPEETVAEVTEIFNRSGKAFVVPEKDLDACTAIASCGIAFFLRFIRAAAEGGVELGLKPGFATEIAALTARGAGALLRDGAHPEAEIDKVTTPGGITIKGLNALEANGFTHAVIEALKATVNR